MGDAGTSASGGVISSEQSEFLDFPIFPELIFILKIT